VARTQVNVNYDQNSVTAMLHAENGPVGRDMRRRGERVLARAKELVGIDTGRLHNSLRLSNATVGGERAVTVWTPVRYARFHHDGTGIFGRSGRPIRPKNARALRFKPRGSSAFVFAASVRGSRPNPFMREALLAAANPGFVARARGLISSLAGRNGAPAAGIIAGRDAAKIPGSGPRPARAPSTRRRTPRTTQPSRQATQQPQGWQSGVSGGRTANTGSGWQRNVSGGRSRTRDNGGWQRDIRPGRRARDD
jgi:hypothetical protein